MYYRSFNKRAHVFRFFLLRFASRRRSVGLGWTIFTRSSRWYYFWPGSSSTPTTRAKIASSAPVKWRLFIAERRIATSTWTVTCRTWWGVSFCSKPLLSIYDSLGDFQRQSSVGGLVERVHRPVLRILLDYLCANYFQKGSLWIIL